MKNVLFFPLWTASPHFETDIELMKKEVISGNKVFFLFCNRSFSICDNNKLSDPQKCTECIRTRKQALRLFKPKDVTVINIPEKIPLKESDNLPAGTVHTVDDLKALSFENYDIGYSIASSLDMDLNELSFEKCIRKIHDFYLNSRFFYRLVNDCINKYQIDFGYILNGRFSFSRAFFQAFIKNNLDVFTHERGSSYKKYAFYKNILPHNIIGYTKRLNEFWERETDFNKKVKIADKFFTDRRFGKETDFISYTNKQIQAKLPDNINHFDKKIVIFNSSSFEYDYISSEYTYKFYKSQLDGIIEICNSMANNGQTGIFLREHPNLKNMNNRQRIDVKLINTPNFFLIPAESDISSYDLLLAADIVITFNSTMGIEATYWGVPSILCSNSIYQYFKIAYRPESHNELVNLLNTEIKPMDKIDALKYGYYHGTFGIDYEFYQPHDLFSGTFLNKDLHFVDKRMQVLIIRIIGRVHKIFFVIKKLFHV